MKKYDFLVVGAGFAGITCAQQLAENGFTVLVVDKRNHIAEMPLMSRMNMAY